MAKLNPYRNLANDLIKKMGTGVTSQFLKKHVKNDELRQALSELIEFKQHVAFEEGRKQGNFETAQALKAIIDVENPGFVDVDDNGGY